MSVNKTILIGNLGRDPEIRTFQDGGKVCNLRIATSEKWKDRDTGESRERTEWHSVTLRGNGLVGIAEKYLSKGDKVYIEGKLQTRKWQDQSGNDRYSTEVVVSGMGSKLEMLSSQRGGSNGYDSSSAGQGGYDNAGTSGAGYDSGSGIDDDIPF